MNFITLLLHDHSNYARKNIDWLKSNKSQLFDEFDLIDFQRLVSTPTKITYDADITHDENDNNAVEITSNRSIIAFVPDDFSCETILKQIKDNAAICSVIGLTSNSSHPPVTSYSELYCEPMKSVRNFDSDVVCRKFSLKSMESAEENIPVSETKSSQHPSHYLFNGLRNLLIDSMFRNNNVLFDEIALFSKDEDTSKLTPKDSVEFSLELIRVINKNRLYHAEYRTWKMNHSIPVKSSFPRSTHKSSAIKSMYDKRRDSLLNECRCALPLNDVWFTLSDVVQAVCEFNYKSPSDVPEDSAPCADIGNLGRTLQSCQAIHEKDESAKQAQHRLSASAYVLESKHMESLVNFDRLSAEIDNRASVERFANTIRCNSPGCFPYTESLSDVSRRVLLSSLKDCVISVGFTDGEAERLRHLALFDDLLYHATNIVPGSIVKTYCVEKSLTCSEFNSEVKLERLRGSNCLKRYDYVTDKVHMCFYWNIPTSRIIYELSNSSQFIRSSPSIQDMFHLKRMGTDSMDFSSMTASDRLGIAGYYSQMDVESEDGCFEHTTLFPSCGGIIHATKPFNACNYGYMYLIYNGVAAAMNVMLESCLFSAEFCDGTRISTLDPSKSGMSINFPCRYCVQSSDVWECLIDGSLIVHRYYADVCCDEKQSVPNLNSDNGITKLIDSINNMKDYCRHFEMSNNVCFVSRELRNGWKDTLYSNGDRKIEFDDNVLLVSVLGNAVFLTGGEGIELPKTNKTCKITDDDEKCVFCSSVSGVTMTQYDDGLVIVMCANQVTFRSFQNKIIINDDCCHVLVEYDLSKFNLKDKVVSGEYISYSKRHKDELVVANFIDGTKWTVSHDFNQNSCLNSCMSFQRKDGWTVSAYGDGKIILANNPSKAIPQSRWSFDVSTATFSMNDSFHNAFTLPLKNLRASKVILSGDIGNDVHPPIENEWSPRCFVLDRNGSAIEYLSGDGMAKIGNVVTDDVQDATRLDQSLNEPDEWVSRVVPIDHLVKAKFPILQMNKKDTAPNCDRIMKSMLRFNCLTTIEELKLREALLDWRRHCEAQNDRNKKQMESASESPVQLSSVDNLLIAELSKQLKAAYKQAKQSKHHKAIVDSKEVTKLTTIVENEHNPDVKDDEYEKELYEDDSEPDASEEEIEAFKFYAKSPSHNHLTAFDFRRALIQVLNCGISEEETKWALSFNVDDATLNNPQSLYNYEQFTDALQQLKTRCNYCDEDNEMKITSKAETKVSFDSQSCQPEEIMQVSEQHLISMSTLSLHNNFSRSTNQKPTGLISNAFQDSSSLLISDSSSFKVPTKSTSKPRANKTIGKSMSSLTGFKNDSNDCNEDKNSIGNAKSGILSVEPAIMHMSVKLGHEAATNFRVHNTSTKPCRFRARIINSDAHGGALSCLRKTSGPIAAGMSGVVDVFYDSSNATVGNYICYAQVISENQKIDVEVHIEIY